MKRVTYIFPVSHHFRYDFHCRLRNMLEVHGIEYNVVYSRPFGESIKKGDTVDIPWGRKVPLMRIGKALLQWAPGEVLRSDLIIIQQENRLLLNYLVQFLNIIGVKKVAFFGHGRNFQARKRDSLPERWKRFWATKVRWWFAYTEETKRYLVSIGFPESNITVFNNAIDTAEMRRLGDNITEEELVAQRRKIGLQGDNVCVYVGGLYTDKRLPFLIQALDLVRHKVPDFEFVAVGGGEGLSFMEEAAHTRPWLKVIGPRFGKEKVEIMSLGKLFLIPGLVGLAVLDASVLGLPVVTTDYPYHSPEIAYLEDGISGVISKPWDDVNSYSEVVINLLEGDADRLEAMQLAARAVGSAYTIDSMVERFSDGVLSAVFGRPLQQSG